MEEVKVGDAVPSVELSELATGQDRPTKINLKDLVSGKKVAIFGVPGAFTPGCSKSHLPSFISAQSDLQAKGVEMTICLATNDAYTMEVGYVLLGKMMKRWIFEPLTSLSLKGVYMFSRCLPHAGLGPDVGRVGCRNQVLGR
jgi:hypothetical protein